jgi:hypothetical protein
VSDFSGQPTAPSDPSKESLEIAKLQLELRYIRRNFFAQIANTILLVLVGIVVFYFFQRPQIGQMEVSRVAAEKQQIATLVIAAQNLQNSDDRRKMVEMLSEQWPQYEFVRAIAKSYDAMDEKRRPKVISTRAEQCTEYAKNLDELNNSLNQIEASVVKEMLTGRGQSIVALDRQYTEISAQKESITKLRTALTCS